jgi:hypothetical protein
MIPPDKGPSRMEPLDILIRESLLDLARFVARTDWRGREREAVSLYVLGFLIRRCDPSGPLKDPTQIGMDVAVRQHPGPRRKRLVCKDLVIWPSPAGNCFSESGKPTLNPLAILEWKVRTERVSRYDEDWLKEFSARIIEFNGYAVALHPSGAETTMNVTRIKNGVLTGGWLRFPT